MSYELVEWWYAASSENAASAMAYLGSQGDIWDAQKDMLADTLGAIFATTLFFFMHGLWRRESRVDSN
jgi:putative membrane protein